MINGIALHTSASYDWKQKRVLHPTRAEIDRYHREHNGWRCIGYHWYVEVDGHGSQGRRDEEVGAHVGGLNLHTLGICVSGHGDFERWNDLQMREVLRKCAEWCQLYAVPVDRVFGHREAEQFGAPPVHKTCPGLLIDMDEVRRELAQRLATVA